MVKALSGIKRMEVDSFASYYLSNEYGKSLNIGLRKEGNNINHAWQHVVFVYFYRCKIGRPTLIVFLKFPNIFMMLRKGLKSETILISFALSVEILRAKNKKGISIMILKRCIGYILVAH